MGFRPLPRKGGFIGLFGPLYLRERDDGGTVIGLRIDQRHTNIRGIAHGGMLATLADSALGIALTRARNEISLVTVNLSIDYVEPALLGDWVEADVDIQRIGVRLAYASCYLRVGSKRILRASGVFAAVAPIQPKEGFEG